MGGLLGTGQDLYREALDSGRVTEDLNMKVSYSDIFVSPWCCDSSHEPRDPDRGDVPVGARPHHGGPPQRHEPLLPTPGVPITTVGSLQHSKPPEKILTAIAKILAAE